MKNSLPIFDTEVKDEMANFELICIQSAKEEVCKKYANELQSRINKKYKNTMKTQPYCKNCNCKLYKHSMSSAVKIRIKFGIAVVKFPRLRCSNSHCRALIIIGAELIPNMKISVLLSEIICDLASRMSYSQAEEAILVQHGIEISRSTIHKIVQNEGMYARDLTQEYTSSMYENGVVPPVIRDLTGKTLFMGIDGGFVRGWREKESFEVKAVTFSTGVRYFKSANGSKKGELRDRLGYATNASGEEFCKLASTLAIQNGSLSAKQVLAITDGAHWISLGISDWIPEAIHLLDIFHLKHKIYRLFLHSATGHDKTLRDEAIAAVDRYNPAQIIEWIEKWIPYSENKKSEKYELINYILNNKQHILNHLGKTIHGSGLIEKGVDLMISRRLKCRGMGWTENGSEAMVKLKILQYNHSWGDYWALRRGNL
jgi:hypothetical protein